MNKKTTNFTVSALLQKVFITLSFTAFIMQIAAYWPMVSHMMNLDWHWGEFSAVMIDAAVFPLLVFFIAALSSPRKNSLRWRLFEGSFFTLGALALHVMVAQLLGLLVYHTFQIPTYNWFDSMLLYRSLPLVLVLIIYTIVLINYRHLKQPEGQLLPRTQFVYRSVLEASLAAVVLMTAYSVLQQIPTNPNLSSFLTMSLQMIATPVLLFVIAYFFGPKAAPASRRFQAVFYTSMGLMLFTILYAISQYAAPFFLTGNEYTGYWPWVTYTVVVIGVALLVYTAALRYLRNRV